MISPISSPGARLLLGMAIGDAYGARFENLNRDAIDLHGEEDTYREWNRYTDDTQMAAGVAELLVSEEPFTRETLARFLMDAYRRDPRPGYSEITREMLENSEDVRSFLSWLPEEIRDQRRSDGAAMRALPIGWIRDRHEVIRCAALSAAITHGHPDAIAATVGIALLAHERYYTGAPFASFIRRILPDIPGLTSDTAKYLKEACTGRWDPGLILGSYRDYGVPYTESIILLGAVLALLVTYGNDPHQVLVQAVRLGGDTDTTASIALGVALIYPGSDTLPKTLVDGLERGAYGRDFLVTLGNRLDRRYPLPPRKGPEEESQK